MFSTLCTSGSKFTARKGAFLSDILGFRVNKDGTICDSEDEGSDADDNDDQLLNSRSPFVFLGHTGVFATGQTLKPYQALDLKLLIAREQGKPVVRDAKTTEIKNTIGSILAYPMGYGKTVVSIALILANLPGKDFKKIETGCPANLIAVPHQGLIKQWRTELKAFSPTLRSLKFGPSIEVANLQATDAVLITYTQLAIQFDKYQKNPQAINTLFSVRWYRFIADESHQFRNPNTQAAKAAWGVTKTHGLCLTGTLVQNSVRDFHPLYRFLEVEYEGIIDINVFHSKVYGKSYKGPILPGSPTRIYETLKKNFCIFRDPIDPITTQPILSLTVRKDKNVKIWPTPLELQFYETIDGLKLHPLAKTTRLRQACAHPCLLSQFLNPSPNGSAMVKRQNRKKDRVPNTSSQLPSIDGKEIATQFKKLLHEHYMSSKLKKMLEILAEHAKDEKAIIFVNFTSLIPSVEHALRSENIGYTKYTGGMSDGLREASLKKIESDAKCRVLIISIQAGALGLHIVACNIVMILEPWWNPYRDDQAISRVHRIGQTKPVHVYRFVTMNTIESNSLWKTQIQKRSNLINIYGEYHYGEEVDYIADSEECRSAQK
ncbi:hypothetical protein HYPSUDRAFT_766772 [Hypholoma sublateritium FD-334 SS-4]|uniref:Helicase C-terminal domain-containing protein n=1 Tax=Hypholoma sublateritium (strain FD-334 SS-4) TaxID=945553 RepID=A0A0D2NPZ1_HYPSF|nr:hypothetical protein HYPSUDRAFT_766772 [Hypholoma sublateritium FD-334 SS-4]